MGSLKQEIMELKRMSGELNRKVEKIEQEVLGDVVRPDFEGAAERRRRALEALDRKFEELREQSRSKRAAAREEKTSDA